jgi:imidazolonepropionase-like amidohydrolase
MRTEKSQLEMPDGAIFTAESAKARRITQRKCVMEGTLKGCQTIFHLPSFSLHLSASLRVLCGKIKSALPVLCVGLCLMATPESTRAQSLILSNAIVHTVSGETISDGQVLIVEGKIAEIGPNLSRPPETTVVDLQGQHLYPGLIALDTILGLTEIGSIRATQDSTESGEYVPDVESWVAVNPDSELIGVTRANGVAFFEPVPEGGIVSGQSGLVTVEGWTTEQRTVKKPIALHLFWPGMDLDTTPQRSRGRSPGAAPKSLDDQAKERTAKLRSMEEFFAEAGHYAKAKAAAADAKTPALEAIPAWEAMLPYVRGELPVMVHADEIRQIKAALLWAGTNHLKIVIVGGRDAWKTADVLASRKIAVVYAHTFTLPPRDAESYDVQFKAPAVLQKAGVQVSFGNGLSTMDAALTKNLPYSAAQAVAFGLPETEALKGLTLYPAHLAGVSDRLGSIEKGKEATLFASDGSILDARARVTHLWVAGKEVSLENRHTRLYEKYKARPR